MFFVNKKKVSLANLISIKELGVYSLPCFLLTFTFSLASQVNPESSGNSTRSANLAVATSPLPSQEVGKPEILVYSSRNCDFCTKLEQILNKHSIVYKKINITTSEQVKELEEKCGKRTVPQIFVNGVHIGGYKELFMAEIFGNLKSLLKISDNK